MGERIVRYLGSKTLLVDQILETIGPSQPGNVFCDPFGGIGTVGNYMKKKGFCVITGDILLFAHCFQIANIVLNEVPAFTGLTRLTGKDIELYLNSGVADSGWLIQEYSVNRGFFTSSNAKRIQWCIDNIWAWKAEGLITDTEYAFLIASLIQSMDRVANTAGTYYAFLKSTYRKARLPFHFDLIQPTKSNYLCRSNLSDAGELVRKQKCDVLYLDPPYNERDYSRYYHLPETIARGIIPTPHGKSGIPDRYIDRSLYTIKSQALSAFTDLIYHANAKTILFHYTDSGLIAEADVKRVLSDRGKVNEYYFDCKGYRNTKNNINNCKNQHHIYKVIT